MAKNANQCIVWKWHFEFEVRIIFNQVPISERKKQINALFTQTEWGWSSYWLLTPWSKKQNVTWSLSLSHKKKKYEMSRRGYKIMMADPSRIESPASILQHSIYPDILTICVFLHTSLCSYFVPTCCGSNAMHSLWIKQVCLLECVIQGLLYCLCIARGQYHTFWCVGLSRPSR